MKKAWLFIGALLVSALVPAQEADPYAKSRAIIEDLSRIVAPTGVQDSYKTKIGGVEQWLNVRGQDRDNPMILFVHGGPAAPVTPTVWQFQRPIEEYFTVANWDQRASGKSYGETDPNLVADTIRIERYVKDAIEVAEHLKTRYGKRKLILMGHSWGTVVGMQAALERPDLFYAYVGIGQVLNVRENERISFDYAFERAKRENNAQAVKEMAAIAPYPGDQPITRERIIIARKWPQHYGGLSAFRSESGYYFRGPLLSPEYTPQQVKDIDKGNVLTLGRVLPTFLDVDFSKVARFPIPVVMFLGRHDYTTPAAPTVEWMDRVDAPYKRVVWFERSAHMAPWEEPGKTLVSLLEVVRPLAK
ncbi:alpha/beta fold hydrolase [Massilia sp. BKSP1R2A-1]|uniref:alpha/beta fold hydrolase n=1 Tax=Massilia sp. BKSP1R2A-1 TaxID=3422595 RepID=UPI003D34045F